MPSSGFPDTEDLSDESVRAIDCVAHYGITTGTSPTTYSPHDHLTRAQMARFLIRTASALGVES
ncbi:S-layer homology domain-containing protein [Candidatus Spongiisocius sp.]|uniref:S-layer homology domain-containing protein n=1 Tax=Candidatus Spongiisocius sp. TaxID=3101273 RepID=UPI003B5906EE